MVSKYFTVLLINKTKFLDLRMPKSEKQCTSEGDNGLLRSYIAELPLI